MAVYDDFVFAGHGINNSNGSYDPGAVAQGYKENDITRIIAKRVTEIKRQAGINTHYAENHYQNNNTYGNVYTSKAGVSIHINAGGGRGSEIYVPNGEKFLEPDFVILERFNEELGLVNRGVKSKDYYTEETIARSYGVAINKKDYYKEIRQSWEQGISLSIIEIGFIDTEDLNIIRNNLEKISQIIAQETAKISDKIITATNTTTADTKAPETNLKPIKRVLINGKQVGAYRENKNVLEAIEKGLNEEASRIEVMRL